LTKYNFYIKKSASKIKMQSQYKQNDIMVLKELLNKKSRDKDANEKLVSIFKKVDFIRSMKLKDEHLADITASLTY